MNADASPVHGFCLKALLKLGDLNIRRIAGEDKRLTIGVYYSRLSGFLDLAPEVNDALERFAANIAEIKDWKTIEAMIEALRLLGCDKHIPDMYALSNARGKGDYRLAAFHAEKIAPGFNDLYLRVLYTKDEKEESQDEDATLLSCIEALDAGEASRKLLVMAVDDSPAILEAVAAVLNVDYRVFKLPKPDMLETVLKQVEPELFLLDYHMPGLSGFELIPIIRTLPKHKDTPIIFLTSEGTIDNVTAAIALGACDFIVKPFHPDQLLEKVARHIVRKNNLL